MAPQNWRQDVVADGAAVAVRAESLMRKLRSSDVHRAIHAGQTVLCTPYMPEALFSVGNALGRNRLIYALSTFTLVVASDTGKAVKAGTAPRIPRQ